MCLWFLRQLCLHPFFIGSSMPEYAFTLINGAKIEAETIKELEDAFKFLNPLFLAPVKEAALKKGLKVVGIGANLKIEKYTKPQCPVEVVYVKK